MRRAQTIAPLSLVLALALAGPVLAQPAASPTIALGPEATLLNVSAEGRSRRTPDLATFSAGVVTQAKTAREAMSANAARMEAVIAALRRAGVAERDIQTASLQLQPQYYYPQHETPRRNPTTGAPIAPEEPQAPRIIGYQATNSVSVRMRRLTETGAVVDALVGAGANQVDGPHFTLENPEAATDEARTEAMRIARARAELYARAAGLRVARILSISEAGGYFPVSRDIMVTAQAGGAAGAPPPPPSPVQPGELALGVNLSVQFALER